MDGAIVIVDTARYRLITVQGDVDDTSVDDLRLACATELPVVVDLLRCSYIDSTGLSALIVRNRSGNLGLVLARESRIYRIFEITQLLEHFRIAATSFEAVSLLTG